jgi:CBS domain-containing protein
MMQAKEDVLMRTDIQAKDIMTTDTFTVDENTRVKEAATLLVGRGLSNAPVIKKDFTRELLLGFVSEKDLMQCYASGAFYAKPDLKVADIMRPHPVCVRPETDLFTLATIFMQHGYRHVPVVQSQMLQGMVSRRDVLKALLEHYKEWEKQDPATRKVPDIAGIFTPRYVVG